MNPQVVELIRSFETDSKTPKRKYNDFLAYVYLTFDRQINFCKVEKLKNKYIKMRQSALGYIVTNEKAITAEICKNK